MKASHRPIACHVPRVNFVSLDGCVSFPGPYECVNAALKKDPRLLNSSFYSRVCVCVCAHANAFTYYVDVRHRDGSRSAVFVSSEPPLLFVLAKNGHLVSFLETKVLGVILNTHTHMYSKHTTKQHTHTQVKRIPQSGQNIVLKKFPMPLKPTKIFKFTKYMYFQHTQ